MITEGLIVKYNRTSHVSQHGERFNVDKSNYDHTFFDQGVSGTKPFKERTQASKIVEMINNNMIKELHVEELRDVGRNMVDTINTLDWLDKNNVNVVIRSMGNLSSRVWERHKKKKVAIIDDFSSLVAGAGLEPTTFGL
jgi:hypothetical protein